MCLPVILEQTSSKSSHWPHCTRSNPLQCQLTAPLLGSLSAPVPGWHWVTPCTETVPTPDAGALQVRAFTEHHCGFCEQHTFVTWVLANNALVTEKLRQYQTSAKKKNLNASNSLEVSGSSYESHPVFKTEVFSLPESWRLQLPGKLMHVQDVRLLNRMLPSHLSIIPQFLWVVSCLHPLVTMYPMIIPKWFKHYCIQPTQHAIFCSDHFRTLRLVQPKSSSSFLYLHGFSLFVNNHSDLQCSGDWDISLHFTTPLDVGLLALLHRAAPKAQELSHSKYELPKNKCIPKEFI